MRQIVLDTETTGLEVSQGHRIIEIGCVELVSRRPTGRHFHRYLNPEREIDEGAVAVHGYCGLFGGIVAGFALWGYPAIMPSDGTLIALSEGAGWFGRNAEGLPVVTPIGNILGSLVFALGFGLIPGLIIGKLLKMAGLLRVAPAVEVHGLDGKHIPVTYPASSGVEAAFEAIQRKEAKL
jgi:ammonia channel protein AmtB